MDLLELRLLGLAGLLAVTAFTTGAAAALGSLSTALARRRRVRGRLHPALPPPPRAPELSSPPRAPSPPARGGARGAPVVPGIL
jgi:hypothetical protein